VDEFVFAPESSARLRISARPLAGKRLLAGTLAVLIIALTGFVVLSSPQEAQAVVYRYAFKLGETRTYDLQMTVDVTPTGIPDAQPFKGKLGGAVGLDVVEQREDGSAVVELTMSNLTFEPSIGAAGFDPGTLKLSVAPDGRISSVEGTGGILGAAGAAMRSPVTSSGNPTDTASNQFLFPQFPAKGVKPGDSWTESSTMTFPFGDDAITMNVEGTHDGFEDTTYGEAARLKHAVKSPLDLTVPLKDIAPELQAGAVKITGDLSMTTTSLVLPDTSDLVSMDGTITTAMQMVFEGAPALAAQPLSFTATMGVKILRIDGAG
jgi:hypothetical protein